MYSIDVFLVITSFSKLKEKLTDKHVTTDTTNITLMSSYCSMKKMQCTPRKRNCRIFSLFEVSNET